MAKLEFKKIALMGREGVPGVPDTLLALVDHLSQSGCEVILEDSAQAILSDQNLPSFENKTADLLIVVGGDGSLLAAAHLAIDHKIPVLGINRGRLGFLTDIHPNDLHEINAILTGEYLQENRFLLNARVFCGDYNDIALNDVVVLPGDVAQMIEFDVYVNNQLVCHHRADGMIIATPTGSTAYALSGGGPILHPTLNAVALVPMFPHTLSSRPIVVSGDSKISIKVSLNNDTCPNVSCDGHKRSQINPGDEIIIQKKPELLQLIHPKNYNYFHTLREKLHWQKQANRDITN